MISEGVCNNNSAPSVSSINRILRNRAAERAAADFARVSHGGMSYYAPYGVPSWAGLSYLQVTGVLYYVACHWGVMLCVTRDWGILHDLSRYDSLCEVV